MRTLRQDVLYALRQMRLSPIFTLTAMLTLALGIGATTAIFSLIDSVMLKSLPVSDPASLYRVGTGNDCCVDGGPQDNWGMFPYRLYLRFKADAPEFEQMTAFQAGELSSACGGAKPANWRNRCTASSSRATTLRPSACTPLPDGHLRP